MVYRFLGLDKIKKILYNMAMKYKDITFKEYILKYASDYTKKFYPHIKSDRIRIKYFKAYIDEKGLYFEKEFQKIYKSPNEASNDMRKYFNNGWDYIIMEGSDLLWGENPFYLGYKTKKRG